LPFLTKEIGITKIRGKQVDGAGNMIYNLNVFHNMELRFKKRNNISAETAFVFRKYGAWSFSFFAKIFFDRKRSFL